MDSCLLEVSIYININKLDFKTAELLSDLKSCRETEFIYSFIDENLKKHQTVVKSQELIMKEIDTEYFQENPPKSKLKKKFSDLDADTMNFNKLM